MGGTRTVTAVCHMTYIILVLLLLSNLSLNLALRPSGGFGLSVQQQHHVNTQAKVLHSQFQLQAAKKNKSGDKTPKHKQRSGMDLARDFVVMPYDSIELRSLAAVVTSECNFTLYLIDTLTKLTLNSYCV